MAMCNIPSTIDDPSYRYKMPRIQLRIEGRGNGIKTCMVNMAQVAQALRVPASYTTKFLGSEFGAVSSWSEEEQKSIVNGEHQTATAQKLIDKFIDKFVLCPTCRYPETDMLVKKGVLMAGCKACGWSGELDNMHKLVKFILTNPPGGEAAGGKKVKKDKNAKRAEKLERRESKEGDGDSDSDDSGKKAKKKKEKKEKDGKKDKKDKKEKKKKAKDGDDSDSDDEEKKAKKEKKAAKKEAKKEKKTAKKEAKAAKADQEDAASDSDSSDGGAANGDDLNYTDEIIQDSIARLAKLTVEANGKAKGVEKFYDDVRMVQVQNAFSAKLRLYVVLESICGDTISVEKLKPKMGHIKKMITTPIMTPAEIFYGFEVYYVQHPDSRKAYPVILKLLYDNEIVKEDAMLNHYKQSLDTDGFKECQAVGKPFLEWLEKEESESEDESSSDEGSDVDVGGI